jgi:predicted DNA-binding transcriptional regulator AlpA
MAPALRYGLQQHFGDDCIIGARDAAAYLNFSLSHFRTLYRTGVIPPPIKLSERKLGWKLSTLRAWITLHQPVAPRTAAPTA